MHVGLKQEGRMKMPVWKMQELKTPLTKWKYVKWKDGKWKYLGIENARCGKWR